MSERNKSNLMMAGKEATVRCQRRERGGEREREREREREKENLHKLFGVSIPPISTCMYMYMHALTLCYDVWS